MITQGDLLLMIFLPYLGGWVVNYIFTLYDEYKEQK